MKVSKLWGSQNPTQSDGATAGERELRSGGCSPFYTTAFDFVLSGLWMRLLGGSGRCGGTANQMQFVLVGDGLQNFTIYYDTTINLLTQ